MGRLPNFPKFMYLQNQRDEAWRLYKATLQDCRRNFVEWVAAMAALISLIRNRVLSAFPKHRYSDILKFVDSASITQTTITAATVHSENTPNVQTPVPKIVLSRTHAYRHRHYIRLRSFLSSLFKAVAESWVAGCSAQSGKPMLRRYRMAARVAIRSVLHPEEVATWLRWLRSRNIGELLKINPSLPIKPLRPYMATDWGLGRRMDILRATLEFLEGRGEVCRNLLRGRSLVLASFDLPGLPGVSICLAPNSNKEGELILTIQLAGFDEYVSRTMFSFDKLGIGAFAMRIACVQGNKRAYEIDRKMEKEMYGLRPKALVVFVLQELSRGLAVTGIFGVNNARHVFASTHALSKLMGKNVRILQMDYDALWKELDGEMQADGWYRLPMAARRRSHQNMKPNKRAMYRKRYAFMDKVSEKVLATLADENRAGEASGPKLSQAPFPSTGVRIFESSSMVRR